MCDISETEIQNTDYISAHIQGTTYYIQTINFIFKILYYEKLKI